MFALETTLKVKGMFNICFVQKTNFYSYYVLFKASWIINVNHVEIILKATWLVFSIRNFAAFVAYCNVADIRYDNICSEPNEHRGSRSLNTGFAVTQ